MASADAGGRHEAEDQSRDAQRDGGQPTRGDGEAVPAGWVVPFLGQGLEGIEGGDEQRRPGHDEQRGGALPGASGREPGDDAEAADPQDPGRRPPQQALKPPAPPAAPAPPARVGAGGARRVPSRIQGPAAGFFGSQAAAEEDHRSQVLQAEGEAQLGGEAAPPLGGLQRDVAQPGRRDRQHRDGQDHAEGH